MIVIPVGHHVGAGVGVVRDSDRLREGIRAWLNLCLVAL